MAGTRPGPRVFVGRHHRVHHFTVGAAFIALGTATGGATGEALVALGIALCWHDRADARVAFADLLYCREVRR